MAKPKRDEDNPLGLEPVDGMAVIAAWIKKIDNAKGGINRMLEVDPVLAERLCGLKMGDTVYALMRLDVTHHGHGNQPENEGSLRREIELRATDTVIVAAEPAEALIHDSLVHERELRDKLSGQGSLPVDA